METLDFTAMLSKQVKQLKARNINLLRTRKWVKASLFLCFLLHLHPSLSFKIQLNQSEGTAAFTSSHCQNIFKRFLIVPKIPWKGKCESWCPVELSAKSSTVCRNTKVETAVHIPAVTNIIKSDKQKRSNTDKFVQDLPLMVILFLWRLYWEKKKKKLSAIDIHFNKTIALSLSKICTGI